MIGSRRDVWKSTTRIAATTSLLLFAPAVAQFPNEDARIGVNLDFLDNLRPAWTFVDVFKTVREWEISPEGSSVLRDGEGWIRSLAPGQKATARMLTNLDGHYPEGEYVCLYDGEGRLSFDLDGSVVSEEPGRILLDVSKGSTGIVLTLEETNADNPVRNIRVIMPGFEATYQTQVFHPVFLDSFESFGVLRFMDFQRTNGSLQEKWADRATPAYFGQGTERGVALEYMIALCNRTRKDAWFCLPHRADDEYVRRFAETVRTLLDPSLRVYVEYSNEVWNRQFEQANYARDRGLALGLSEDSKIAQFRFYSQRSVEIFRIWEDVFGDPNRLICVLATQQANEAVGREIMDWREAHKQADVLAVAPYYGGLLGNDPYAPLVLTATMDQIIDTAYEDILRCRAYTRQNAANAKKRGLPLIAYEGGQHLAASEAWRDHVDLRRILAEANRHPRMRDLYREDLAGWREAGGGLFMLYKHTSRYNEFGNWGLFEWQDQAVANAPKVLGVRDYLIDDGSAAFIPSGNAIRPSNQHFDFRWIAPLIVVSLTAIALIVRARRRRP